METPTVPFASNKTLLSMDLTGSPEIYESCLCLVCEEMFQAINRSEAVTENEPALKLSISLQDPPYQVISEGSLPQLCG